MIPNSLDEAVKVMRPFIEQGKLVLEEISDGDFMPMCFIFSDARGMDMLPLDFRSEETKDKMAELIRRSAVMMQAYGLWGLMMMADSRYRELDVDFACRAFGLTPELLKARIEKDPSLLSQVSKVRECLLITIETYVGDRSERLFYRRLPNGIIWEAPETFALGPVEGRFVNMLPPPPRSGGQA